MKYLFSKDNYHHRLLLFNLGLLGSLALVLMAFEWKFADELDLSSNDFYEPEIIQVEDWIIPEASATLASTKIAKIQIPKNEQVADFIQRLDELVFECWDTLQLISPFPPEIISCEEDIGCTWNVASEAEFPGGIEAFYQYVQKNLHYPSSALEQEIAGKINVEFEISRDGSLQKIKILRGIHPLLDNEVIQILQKSPAWKPAKMRGRSVKTRIALPITFEIQ